MMWRQSRRLKLIFASLAPRGLLWPNRWWWFKYGVESSQRIRPALHFPG